MPEDPTFRGNISETMIKYVKEMRAKGISPRTELERAYLEVLEKMEAEEKMAAQKMAWVNAILTGLFLVRCPNCECDIET